MQPLRSATLLAVVAPAVAVTTSSPIGKVLELLAGLEDKIIAEGEASQKKFDEFNEWCEDRSKNVGFEIKTGKAQVEDLEASIQNEIALTAELTSKIDDLGASIATDEADLKEAVEIRKSEEKDFQAEEKELVEVVDMIGRAINVLEKELAKGGAAMVQVKNARSVTQAFAALVQASAFSTADESRLTALLQSSQDEDEDDAELGAPDAAAYKSKSGGIVDTLEDLSEKAQTQLEEARKKETAALHNFQMLKQSLDDQIEAGSTDLADSKKGKATSAEKKAIAEGDLHVTKKDLSEDQETKSGLHHDCMKKAEEFSSEVASRGEEMKALGIAKKAIQDNVAGASSFLQYDSVSTLHSSSDLAKFEAVRFVRDLARKTKDSALTQLASRMASAMRLGSTTKDPFAKVKVLINDMISKLEDSAKTDASHKAYCDKELAESGAKKDEATTDVEKLSTKIDQMTARSAQLKEESSNLQKAVGEIIRSQGEMDKMRHEEKAAYTANKAEVSQGLEGVKMALKVLRDYYAKADGDHNSKGGAASSIVGMLEVVESDFTKGLFEMTATEESSQSTFETETQGNIMAKSMKEKDVKYKQKESAGLDKAVADANSDRAGVQAELDAVVEYLDKLEEMCVAKAEPYAEKARRRAAEISGLKQALQILDGEAVLLQQAKWTLSGRRNLKL